MRIIACISFCLLFISCNESIKKTYPCYTDFPVEQPLYAAIAPLDTILLRYPFRVAEAGGVAIILDLHNADHFLHAFTYPAWQHITSFGKRGNGPEELLSAASFRFHSPDSLWVLDANKMQITRWRIDEGNHIAERLEEINLDKQLLRTLDFDKSPEGFIVSDYTGAYRYHLLDKQGRILESKSFIPTENTRVQRTPALAQAWRSFMDYNPQNNTLALVTQLGEVAEIVDVAADTGHVVYGPNKEPRFRLSHSEGIPTGIMGFSDVQVTESHIYAVFHGRTFKEIEKVLQAGKQHEDGGRFIYVFDLDGSPVMKYVLDRAIYGIYVNEATNTIIATDVNSDEPIIQYTI